MLLLQLLLAASSSSAQGSFTLLSTCSLLPARHAPSFPSRLPLCSPARLVGRQLTLRLSASTVRGGGRLCGRRSPIRLPWGRKHVAAHHRHPPPPQQSPGAGDGERSHRGASKSIFDVPRADGCHTEGLSGPQTLIACWEIFQEGEGRGTR